MTDFVIKIMFLDLTLFTQDVSDLILQNLQIRKDEIYRFEKFLLPIVSILLPIIYFLGSII